MKKKLKQIWIEYFWKNAIAWVIGALLSAVYITIKSFYPEKTLMQFLNELLDLKFDLKSILVVLLLFAIIYFVYSLFKFKYTDSTRASDIELFNKIRNQYLDQDNTLSYLRNVSFRGSFNAETLDGFDDFNDKCRNSDFKFLNPRLEKLKIELLKDSQALMGLIAEKTLPVRSGIQRIPQEWEQQDSQKFNGLVREMHDLADKICKTYDRFIIKGRAELEI